MANDPNDWNKRLAALQNKQDPNSIDQNDLNNRLGALQAYQKKDVNPNATTDDLWNRLNKLDTNNVNNDINPYNQTGIQYKNKQSLQNSKLAEHQADALLGQIGDELNLEKSAPKGMESEIKNSFLLLLSACNMKMMQFFLFLCLS